MVENRDFNFKATHVPFFLAKIKQNLKTSSFVAFSKFVLTVAYSTCSGYIMTNKKDLITHNITQILKCSKLLQRLDKFGKSLTILFTGIDLKN